ncbi:MAG: C10 family peptidase [Paludibacteraceae bacterium]|nr:C10 family peptidase [Paludibacteraceae bacterium]
MKKIWLVISTIIACLSVNAQQISETEAMATAQRFLHRASTNGLNQAPARENVSLELAYTQVREGKTLYYVFNEQDADKGFIIVGGDQSSTEILGYCNQKAFVYDSLPPSMQWWLSQYDEQISRSIRMRETAHIAYKPLSAEAEQVPQRAAAQTQTVVAPLMSTEWNQGYPYNANLPWIFPNDPEESNQSRNRLATGCVATAMAQVMKYHNYPTTGTGTHRIGRTVNGVVFSANFGATTYDWTHMQNTYTGSEQKSSAAVQSVATLMYHCGVALDANYNTLANDGTSASNSDVAAALIDYFGYDRSTHYVSRSGYNDAQWEQLILNELQNNRPVLYGGQSNSGGHSFVVDGYDGTLYHINWGWGGYCDSYFALTGANALRPEGSGVGGAGNNAAYTGRQDAIINIKPDEGGDYVYSMRWIDTNYGAHGFNTSTIAEGGTFVIYGGFQNISAVSLSASIAVKFTSTTSEDVYYRDFTSVNYLNPNYYTYSTSGFAITATDIPAGTYLLTIAFQRGGSSQWTDFISSEEPYQLTITESDGNDEIDLSLYDMQWIDVESYNMVHQFNESYVAVGDNVTLQGGFWNIGALSISASLAVKFTSISNPQAEPVYKTFGNVNDLPTMYYNYYYNPSSVSTANMATGLYDLTLAFMVTGSNTWKDFVLPSGEEPHRLEIYDPNSPTGMEQLDDQVRIERLPMGIRIMGAEGQSATICTVTGQMVGHINQLSASQVISLPDNGLYIVRIGAQAETIIL